MIIIIQKGYNRVSSQTIRVEKYSEVMQRLIKYYDIFLDLMILLFVNLLQIVRPIPFLICFHKS